MEEIILAGFRHLTKPEIKTCSKCGLPKDPENDFYKTGGRVKGNGVCKDCEKEYSRNRAQQKKDQKDMYSFF